MDFGVRPGGARLHADGVALNIDDLRRQGGFSVDNYGPILVLYRNQRCKTLRVVFMAMAMTAVSCCFVADLLPRLHGMERASFILIFLSFPTSYFTREFVSLPFTQG